jgi:hypothetical protein
MPRRLWIDDERDAPEGWERLRTLGEARRAFADAKVGEVSLGGSAGLVDSCAQELEQGAFTQRIRPLRVVVHAAAGPARTMAEQALANAARHWASAPPPAPPVKRRKRSMLLRFLVWHLLGFGLVFGGVEAWYLIRHGHHAPIFDSLLTRLRR